MDQEQPRREFDFPLLPNGEPMKRFEARMFHKDGGLRKAIFIDGEELDWSVDTASLRDAMMMGPKFYKAIQKDICEHFVASVSDFIGRRVTAEDIKRATKTGWL